MSRYGMSCHVSHVMKDHVSARHTSHDVECTSVFDENAVAHGKSCQTRANACEGEKAC